MTVDVLVVVRSVFTARLPLEVAELSTRSASSTTNNEWDVSDQEDSPLVNPLEGADNLCEHKYRLTRCGPVSPVLATEQRSYPHGVVRK